MTRQRNHDMTAHTPGPWKCVEGNRLRTFNQISIRPVHPAIKGFQCPLAKVERFHGGQANARLIAAAPDLLAALNAMLTHMGMDEDEWNRSTFEQARMAVEKATL